METQTTIDHNLSAKGPTERTKIAVIIGAGPAGLTAAYELLTRANDIKPIILEQADYLGGISRTANYKGNRIDIGGHRFFSKSDRVMNWWLKQMPLCHNGNGSQHIKYHGMAREVQISGNGEPKSQDSDLVMLLRRRKSRIYFLRKFFDYPISLTSDTLRKLGLFRTIRIACSYLKSLLLPVKDARNLEQFFINRFGRELYRTFFKSYTEKVWGVPCHQISSEWGEQRIKGLSITKTITHFLKQRFGKRLDLTQRQTETSLIEQFLYPKLGPGQMWESIAQQVRRMGGEILMNCTVVGLRCADNRVRSVIATDARGEKHNFSGDYFFSTMPVKELIRSMNAPVPQLVKEVSEGLLYRDFVTVGLLVKNLAVSEKDTRLIEDNWIYIQEPDVLAGRLQIFNNWSPYMVANPNHVWIGVEYFCYESDSLWNKPDPEMAGFASEELDRIGIIRKQDVLDSVVIRMPKTYPAYFGTYHRFGEIRQFVDRFDNLFLIGRNGMHRYNNQDHSMLTAMTAVDNIIAGRLDKANIWEINTEMEYHESSKQPQAPVT